MLAVLYTALCRTLRIEYPKEWPRYAVGMIPPDFDGDPEDAPMWAGESASSVNDIKPAAEIVRDLVREAEAALGQL